MLFVNNLAENPNTMEKPEESQFMFLAAVHHLKTTLHFAWAFEKAL